MTFRRFYHLPTSLVEILKPICAFVTHFEFLGLSFKLALGSSLFVSSFSSPLLGVCFARGFIIIIIIWTFYYYGVLFLFLAFFFSPQTHHKKVCELHQLGRRLLSRYTKAAPQSPLKFVWISCPKCTTTTSCHHVVSCPQIQFAFLTWFLAHHGARESIYFPMLKLGFKASSWFFF